MQRRSSVPLRASSGSAGAGALEAGLGAAQGSSSAKQPAPGDGTWSLGSHAQVPTRVAALDPSRTQEVRSERAWRRFDPRGRRRRSILGLPLLSPVSRWVARWDAAVSGWDLTYTAYLVPLSVGFASQARIDWLVALDFAATAIYLADLLVGLHVGFILQSWTGRRKVVLDGPTCLRQYNCHGSFLWDAAAGKVAVLALGGGSVAWKLLHFLRMFRLLRATRLGKAVWGAALSCGPGGSRFLFGFTTAGMYAVCVVWTLALLTNLLGCFWWWLAEVQGIANSWVEGPYVSTQLHLGDLGSAAAPVRWLYRWACVVTLIFEVAQASSRRAHKASVLLDQLFATEGWMQERLLPGDLQQRVRRFYAEVWAPMEAGDEAEQLRELPAALRADVVGRLAGPALRASRLLRPLPEEALRFLAADLQPCHTPAGLDIFKQGQEAQGRCYVLRAGEVAILRGWRRVATVHAPALLGQAALLEPHLTDCPEAATRIYTARALSTCSLWCLDASRVASLLQDDPGLLRCMAAAYLQYLDELALPTPAQQLAPAGPGPAESPPPAAPAAPPHLASMRRALQGLLQGGAPPAAGGGAPGVADGPAATQQQWLEVQAVEAAAASAMQEHAVEGST